MPNQGPGNGITEMVNTVSDAVEAAVDAARSGIDSLRRTIEGLIDSFARAFNMDPDTMTEDQRERTGLAASVYMESAEVGELVEEGNEDRYNMYRVPESISLPEYRGSAEPYQWYDTPRGPCWLEHGEHGDVLIPANKMRFFYRDEEFNSSFETVGEYLEHRLLYVRLNEDGTLSYVDREQYEEDPRVARLHPTYVARFALAWQEIYDAGIRYDIQRLSTFRFMGTSRQDYPYMSQHGMGLSIDFNPSHNDWEAGITPDYDETFMRIMARHGFRPPIIWGSHEDGHDHGYESINADWMHFDMVPAEDGTLRQDYTEDLEEVLTHFEGHHR